MSTKGVGTQDARRSVPRMQGDGSTIESGGIMGVAMWDFHLAWV